MCLLFGVLVWFGFIYHRVGIDTVIQGTLRTGKGLRTITLVFDSLNFRFLYVKLTILTDHCCRVRIYRDTRSLIRFVKYLWLSKLGVFFGDSFHINNGGKVSTLLAPCLSSITRTTVCRPLSRP